MTNLDLSLIIPCYNEEVILEGNTKQIFEILDGTRFNYEIIFVDDRSQDNTKDIIEKIISDHPDKKIKKIFHEKNRGRGSAVSDGIKASSGEVAGFIDIDLEVHARYIPYFILAIKKGFDIAVAHRVYKFNPKAIFRFITSKGYIFLVRRLLKVNLKDTESGFKFFSREKILPIVNEIKEEGWFWDTEIMARAFRIGYKIKEIPCLFLKNPKKHSTVNVVRDSTYYFKKLWEFRKCERRLKK